MDVKLEKIDASDFWCLIEELIDDESGFLNNRITILEAYKHGNLYGLRVIETEEMYERGASTDEIYCENSFYLLPCFCVKEENRAIIIWTHSRVRKMGFGRKLIKLLKIEYAYDPLPGSIDFWKKCNIKII
jgi:hypothetical protein